MSGNCVITACSSHYVFYEIMAIYWQAIHIIKAMDLSVYHSILALKRVILTFTTCNVLVCSTQFHQSLWLLVSGARFLQISLSP
ncbi:hypothetical protein C1H46_035470 [Malus baccata]|uniref:Uncharacterized protein n=1 Tax=Malus baccata TaxID=106549 RepID=A0A540KXP4_MALBA|nr:hypothetical protein C1H46_035470 [Malus baccata]